MDLEKEIELMMPNLRAYVGMLDNACSALETESRYLDKIVRESESISDKDFYLINHSIGLLDNAMMRIRGLEICISKKKEDILNIINDESNDKKYN